MPHIFIQVTQRLFFRYARTPVPDWIGDDPGIHQSSRKCIFPNAG
jgi:hypothetical protein